MDYKEKYEKALEKIRDFYQYDADSEGAKRLEILFPELKESEDERIRKAILELVKQSSHILNPMNQKSMIGWLKKQGELVKEYEDKLDRISCESFDKGYKAAIEKQGVKNPVWSVVDENLLNSSIENLTELKNNFGDGYGRVGDCINWLKSLKERYAWKPSDKQIGTLGQWLRNNRYNGDARYCYPIFDSLHQDLKKLREE